MKHQSGFSLLELLCVLAILSILAYSGSTQFLTLNQRTQDKNTLQNSIKQLSGALIQARQLAVVSGNISYVCGGMECDGDWASGFTLYQDSLSSPDTNDVYQHRIFDDALMVSWRGFPANKHYIEFKTNGLSGYQNGTFQFCLGEWHAGVVLNQSGRFYLTDIEGKEEGACL